MLAGDFLVLLVEDNADSRAAAEADLERALPFASVDWAGDMTTARQLISVNEYDLAICDLKIPAREGDLSTSETNGVSVVSELMASHPGTAIIILSGYGTVKNTEPYTSNGEILPAFGLPSLRMCQAAVKADPADFFDRIDAIRVGVDAVGSVCVDAHDDLDSLLERAITHYAAEQGFSKAKISRAGGLSGSSNAIVELAAVGRPTKRLFVKVDRRDWVLDELRRRETYVEGVLDARCWAPTISILKAGLRGSAAYFSGLATDPQSLFEVVAVAPDAAVATLERIESVVAPWQLGQPAKARTVGSLRSEHVSDQTASKFGVDLTEFDDVELLSVEVADDIVHGDFHADNILVDDQGRPLLIDFAYTGIGPAPVDPITLEMAFLFHPMSPFREMPAESVVLDRWAQGDYLTDPRYLNLIRYCREWAHRNATESGVLAVAYALAIRYLKRDGVDPRRALTIARSCADELRRIVQ